MLASASPLLAASLDGRSIRVGAGIVSPDELPAAPFFLAALRFRLSGLALEVESGFWSKSEIAFGLESSIRDVQLGTSLTWSPLRLGRLRGVLGAGPSAHFVTSSAGKVAGERASGTSVRLGIQAWAGLEIALGPRSALFIAGRGDWILRQEREDELEGRVYAGVRVGF